MGSLVMLRRSLLASPLLLAAAPARAEWVPKQPIHVIVGFAPGGTADIAARIAGEAIQRRTGQIVVVDSKTGALGFIALKAVANAAPDGYTVGIGIMGSLAVAPVVPGSQIPLDLDKELLPICNLVGVPMALIVRPNAPFKTVAELIAYAKDNPGKVTYGSTGNGSTNQLGAELFAAEAGGLKLLHVPYRGGAPAIADVATGQIDIFFANVSEIVGQIQSGQVRALALASSQPNPMVPDLPLLTKDIATLDINNWFGLVGPRRPAAGYCCKPQQALSRCHQRSSHRVIVGVARTCRRSAGRARLQGGDPEGPRALGEGGEAGQYQSGMSTAAPLSLGIDIGGTFTDLVIHDPRDGRAVIWKESTTPDDPARGTLLGTRKVLEKAGAKPEQIGRVVHATTLFTNALIERKGAKTGLLTTAGFRDVLEIGRERKYELYDLFIEMPKPLVARPWRREAMERLAPDGTVEIPLDVDAALAEVADLVKQGVESLAICFLHAYANPTHERAIGAAVAERFQNLSLSLSSDIAPEIREYLRASTTVANAFVRPLAEIYLERLEQALRDEGIPGGLFLMLSNGGLTHVSEAKRAPVQLLESGPAAGALAGAWFGRNAGLERVLAFDMGGTTAKLALVDEGEPLVAYGFEAAREKRFLRGSGLPIQIATVELIEIGAGGGSIAHRSELGTLNVGPESSGAQPGPACYGRGGSEATVTDADLTLGYLNADFFLGGAMQIDRAATDGAFGRLAKALDVEPGRAAFGVHDVVNENMAGAARVAIAERGRIPAEYALLATGGAGPVHAWHVARKLGITRIVCPPGAGAGSTIGMLMAPARVDRVASFNVALAGADFAAADRVFAGLEKESIDVLRLTGADIEARTVGRLADMRYIGQGSEITVVLPQPITRGRRDGGVRAGLQGAVRRTPPGAAIQFVALAPLRQRADARHRRHARTAAPSVGRGAQGNAACVLSRRRQDAADAGLRPLCAGTGRAASTAPRCSRRTRAPSSSVPAPRRACWPTVPSWRRLADGCAQEKQRVRSHRARAFVAAADLHGRRGRRRHGAHQLLDPGARELRFLLRHHRRRGPVAGPGEREHPELHRHPAGDGEALPALLPARPARAGRRLDHQRHLAGHRPSARHHPGQADLQGRQAGGLQRHHGARARHRRQDPESRAARGLRGGPADPADEDDRRRQDRRDPGHHHPQERAHARPDDGRSVGAGRGARPDGGPAARADGGL